MLPGGDIQTVADEIYKELTAAGVEVLYDDREERAGVKFNDADLIGIPLRLTVSGRSLQNGGLEFKRRDSKDGNIIARESVGATMQAEIQSLLDAVRGLVVEVPYRV